MDRYRTVLGACMTDAEREWLKDVATRFPDGVIVNIGVLYGCSLHCLYAGAPDATLVGVDIQTNKVRHEEELSFVKVEGDSGIIHADFHDEIDLLFVDGDHHYEAVKKDIAGWIPKVAMGGIVAFHDYTPRQVDLDRIPTLADVRRAIDEWEKTGWEQIEAPGSIAAFERVE